MSDFAKATSDSLRGVRYLGCGRTLPVNFEVGLPAEGLAKAGAGDGIRTRNRLFTKQVLYR